MLKVDNLKEILFKIIRKPYAIALFCVILAVGLLLTVSGKNEEKNVSNESTDVTHYTEQLQKTVKNMICKMNSVEDCSVMITVSSIDDNDYVANYNATSSIGENNTQNNTQKEYLVINDGGGDSVVVRSKKMPKIGGVLIVYEGTADIMVKKNITDAVATALGIQMNKVFVVSTCE